jgi:uncharacterized protein DUF4389
VQGVYPLNLDVSNLPRVARWRPLVNWLLVIPHQFWLFLLFLGAHVVALLAWFTILFTGRLPDSWSDYLMGVLRYQWRVNAYLYAWTDQYPDFHPPAGYIDPGRYPAVLYCARPLSRDRVTVLFRAFMVIPHYVVLFFVSLAGSVVLFAAWFVVLFTGTWPEGMRRFCIGWIRWITRVQGYQLLVTDSYPPFGFDA